jgi:hypothetical protein
MFSRGFLAFLVAALVGSASAARPAPAAAVAQPVAAQPATAPAAAGDAAKQQAAYEKAVQVSDVDRAAAAPIISFLKRIPQPPGEWKGCE